MYKEVINRARVNQPPEFTARVLTYEIGDIHKLMIYKERFGECGYLGELKIALADAITQLNLLSEQLGYDIEDLNLIGYERFCYRIDEVGSNEHNRL